VRAISALRQEDGATRAGAQCPLCTLVYSQRSFHSDNGGCSVTRLPPLFTSGYGTAASGSN
jgi:hypothetical protein